MVKKALFYNIHLIFILFQSQHIDFNFVRGGGYITAFGAFIEGAKRQQKNSTK